MHIISQTRPMVTLINTMKIHMRDYFLLHFFQFPYLWIFASSGITSPMCMNFIILINFSKIFCFTWIDFMHFFFYWTKRTINFIIWSRCSFIYGQSRLNKIGNFNEVSLFNHIPLNSWPIRSCCWGKWGCYWWRWWNWPRPRMNSVCHNN